MAFFRPLCALAALLLAAAAHAVQAVDVELLPGGLLTPTSAEQTKPGQYRKPGPWRIGVSWAGVGNTWIEQVITEMRYAAAQDRNIGEFTLVEAAWQPARQAADVDRLLAQKVDLLIIAPISQAVGAPLIAKAAQAGVPVVTLGAYGRTTASATELWVGGRAFGRQGGEFLRKELGGKGDLWVFRGVAGVDEEQQRYDGLTKAIENTNLRITHEVFGDWNYAKAKGLCEGLVRSGAPVDGIWFSGAEMTRACIDVFQAANKPLVPMTGEANNGFLRLWKQTGVKTVAPIATSGVGTAAVRAAAALLEGKPLYRSYYSMPAPITRELLDKYLRPDLNDAYWVPSALPEAEIAQKYRAR